MASEKNPLEEYLSKKTAGEWFPPSFGEGLRSAFQPGQIGQSVGRGALAAGGAAGVGMAGMAVQKLYDAATKSRDFKAMLAHNPDLVEKHEEDPRLFNQMFSTLRTFNPEFSKDPLVAGNYMRQMVLDPVSAGGKAVEALNYRDKMRPGLTETVTRAALGGKKK